MWAIGRREMMLGGAMTLAGLEARAQAPAQEVRIGVIYPLSGANAQIGVDARHAIEAAAEVVNGRFDLDLPGARNAGIASLGGARLRLVFADHQGDPQKARSEAERLITQEKVCAIIGAFQSSASATISVTAERYGVPFVIADSSSPSLHKRGLKFMFRPAGHDEMFTATMFDFLDALRAKGVKVETLGLFFEDTIWGTDSSNVQRRLAAERGYRVVNDIKYRASSPSLSSEVQQLKTGDPDVLLPSSYTTDAILLIKTMAEVGYKPRNILAQAGGFAEKAVYDAVGAQVGGLISRASFALDLAARRPAVGAVNDLFKQRAKRDLNDNTSRQFMAMLVLADAIDRAGSTDGQHIRAALAATDISGERTIMPWRRIHFDAQGQNPDADGLLIQYVGGNWVTVFPQAFAAAEPLWPMNA
ncbi:MAG: ABC transporter substrate-binding protein [Rhizobiales bacterium]|nr:ABC transporter substrate-binding protein [Hyphomicrobiales bacterium]